LGYQQGDAFMLHLPITQVHQLMGLGLFQQQ